MDSALDRLPPHNYEAEQAVLGSMIIDRDAVIKIAANLKPEFFYSSQNAAIYQAILNLYNRRQPADLITVTNELESMGMLDDVGGQPYLASLVNNQFVSVHVEFYAEEIERQATRRRLIDAGTRIVGIGYQDELETPEALDEAERTLRNVSADKGTRDFKTMPEVLSELFDTLLSDERVEQPGVPSGYHDLDELTGGFQRSDLIILAARPSTGKSGLALGFAYGAALANRKHVGIFSLEMSADQLVSRLLSMETGIDTHDLRLRRFPQSKLPSLSNAFGRLSEAPIYIDDGSAATVMDIRSKARRLQSEVGLDLLIVDYLQLMQGRRQDSRVNEVSEISRGLKGIARELNIPVIALSQLSRAVEQRADHRPMLSDLRESGAIEQDADIVMFIYREDRYTETPTEPNVAEIIVAKHRNGPVKTIKLHFEPRFAKFSDWNTFGMSE
ncbi:MAG: replicative DNA helicase [Thermomicrobiales bacterium]|nr:replicative DNA helicase [Thermomicrobiales bacterium]MCO5223898.1 replicative DNA helicase [Thermomicrobiales bacterium]MCO5227461.1 replicative DNA helicase [Thermomicrobiales bacterium]